MIDSLGQGGAEHSLAAILPGMRDLGIDVELVCRYRADSYVEQRLVDQGVAVTTMPNAAPLSAMRWLRRYVSSTAPSLLHLNLFTPTMIGSMGTIGTGVPILISIVSTPEARRPGVATWKLRVVTGAEGFATRHLCSMVHAVTPGVADSVRHEFRVAERKIRVAERGRDGSRFRPAHEGERPTIRDDLGVDGATELVVAVGRHEHPKGFDVLLDAVEILQADRPGFVLMIAGRSGQQTAAMRVRIAALRRPEDVRILGDRRDVDEILRAADVFVLSSRREGAAGAAIEAMATRLPIVASDLAGLVGILDDNRNALLVPIEEPAELARSIGQLLDDRNLAATLADAGHSTFVQRFGLDRATRSMAALYTEAAAKSPVTWRSLLPFSRW
ncbi:MAG: glycosyltransferase family 4 protein [Ilumatobacter sp.]|uniref:glycosyltransferase family 4 protein n=1 Tax=Ilumatobacter sp. TaxID=1967498 RepID=UPI003298DC51